MHEKGPCKRTRVLPYPRGGTPIHEGARRSTRGHADPDGVGDAGVLANVSAFRPARKTFPPPCAAAAQKTFPGPVGTAASFAVTLSSVRPSARPPAPATSKRTDDTHTHTTQTQTSRSTRPQDRPRATSFGTHTHAVCVSPPTDAHPATCDTDKRAHRQTYRHTCSHERKSVLHAILDVAQRVHAPRLSPHLP